MGQTTGDLRLTNLVGSVYHIEFPSQTELASTMLRFQEHYESPRFRGEVFSRAEYEKWYAERNGAFTYLTDWSGFNVPSRIFDPFYRGAFNPLSWEEIALLKLVGGIPRPFYLIATAKSCDPHTLVHEIGHGLYATNIDYRTEAHALLEGCQLAPIFRFLYGGYHYASWLDEAHAYLMADYTWLRETGVLKNDDLQEIHLALASAFDHYTDKKFTE